MHRSAVYILLVACFGLVKKHITIDTQRKGLAMQTGSPYKFTICYIVVGSYIFHNQGKVFMGEFCNRFAYKRPISSAYLDIPTYPEKQYNYKCPMAT